MPSLNKVILVGRLTRDPEMRYTTSGLAVTTFSIAVDRRFKSQSGERQTDFFNCKAWRQKAEFVANYVTKGRLVAVEGSIEINEVTGQDGQKKKYYDIVCDQVETLDSAREHGEGGAPGGGMSTPAAGGHDDYHAEPTAGGTVAGGDNGYFPDDDMGAAPAPSRGNQAGGNQMNRPAAQAQRPANPNAGGPGSTPRAAGAPQRPAQTMNRPAQAGQQGGQRPAAQAQPAYPQDDFDDSEKSAKDA